MDLDIARKLLRKCTEGHSDFILRANVAERYYRKQNDIIFAKKSETEEDNPLRQADNRIPGNFHKLLVNQKTAYAFTDPPRFDVGEKTGNETVRKCLGDAWAKKCKALCVQAANAGVAWVHYWKDADNRFRYAVLDSRQVVPVWTDSLEKGLKAALRVYAEVDDKTGDSYYVYEIWTEKDCQAFRRRIDQEWDCLQYYPRFAIIDIDSGIAEMTDTYAHDFGEVPFIFFNNNDEMTSDLDDIKHLVDAYDKVFSGFVNDLEDIQEIIFILTNYGGEADNTAAVLREMKKKVIMVDSAGPDDKSGVSTLNIEIPVEARKELLTLIRKAIFEQGMGIDPDPQNFGNSSGVALKYLYSLLELKTGMMETEFRISFNRLIRAIMRFHRMPEDMTIIQTWRRSSVTDDAELANICNSSKGIVSDETIVRSHPLVDDPEKEMMRLEEQKKAGEPQWDRIPIKVVKDGEEEE